MTLLIVAVALIVADSATALVFSRWASVYVLVAVFIALAWTSVRAWSGR